MATNEMKALAKLHPREGLWMTHAPVPEIGPEGQARLAKRIPVAQDITAEADSGGHTDNQSALALIPTLIALRDQIQERHGYRQTLRVGAAGGISTPISAAAALSMGAAYILTGSINQACVEAGTSDIVRKMLADAEQADITMAPAADMFEMGVKVQVLKRGTMFAMRAQKLYELYRACDSLDSIPKTDMAVLEKSTFRAPVDVVWTQCRNFFADRDPAQLERAAKDPKHKMSLVFRWYLGQSSHWANAGDPTRVIDYQIWCGPAMGAFNGWVKGSFLEEPEERSVVKIEFCVEREHVTFLGHEARIDLDLRSVETAESTVEYRQEMHGLFQHIAL